MNYGFNGIEFSGSVPSQSFQKIDSWPVSHISVSNSSLAVTNKKHNIAEI
jgi:hypothetical protein